ncbi:BEACH domain-containing protein lvsA [Bienertia sinuspersici]
MVWGIGSRKEKGAANASSSSIDAIPQSTMPTLGIVFQKREHQQVFVSLSSRKIMSTKFFDGQALEALGCRQQVTQLLSNLGWDNFITYRDYTYKRLTLEFLATLETNSTPSDPNDQFSNPNITMNFQMFNQQHSLTLYELNTIFGWLTDAEYGPMGFWAIEDCDADLFWQGISGEESFNSRASKASWIVSPVLRIVHRLLVMAFGEVFKSAILSGSMITIIARALGHSVDVDSVPRGPVDNDILLDLGAMRSKEFFQGNRAMRSPFKWLMREKELMMVPSPHTHFESRDFMLPPNEFSKSKKTKRSTFDEAGPSFAPHRHSTSSVLSSEMQMILEHMSSLHVQQQQTTECVLGLRHDMDVLNRVVWRNHLANVYHSLAPGFPNHPMYPPSFDPTPGPFMEPRFSTSHYPYYAPYFPPPKGNDDDDS